MIERSASAAPPRRQHLDIEATHAATAALLDTDGPLPRFDELDETVQRLRGHLRDFISTVEDAAHRHPAGDVLRVAALLAVESARAHLDASPGSGLVSATQYARSLARELRSLCDHRRTLTVAVPESA